MSSENDEVTQDSVDVGNKMNKMGRQSEQTVGTSNNADRRRHFVEDVPLLEASNDSGESFINPERDLKIGIKDLIATEYIPYIDEPLEGYHAIYGTDTSPLLGISNDSEESSIKPDSDLKRECEDAIEQVGIEVEDVSLKNIHMNTFPGFEQSLEDQSIDRSNNKSSYNEKSGKPHTYRMDSNQNHASSNVENAKLIEKTSAVVEEKNCDIEITNNKPSLTSDCDSEIIEEVIVQYGALEQVLMAVPRQRVSIGDYHYIRMNAFPLTKHDALSSLDSVSSDEVDAEVFEDIKKENCSALRESKSVKKQEKYKRDEKRVGEFLGPYSSRDSLEAVDIIDAGVNGNNEHDEVDINSPYSSRDSLEAVDIIDAGVNWNNEHDEVDINSVPKINISTDWSESVVKKHASVLGEPKCQVKAVKQEQLPKEKNARRRLSNVLKELKAYSLELDEKTKWIQGHIKRRECSSFIPPANTPEEE